MKASLQKFFKKRKAAEEVQVQVQEQYQTVESNQLAQSSPEDLMQVIYRYDTEVKRLNKAIEDSRSVQAEHDKGLEEAQLYKKHNETLQKHVQDLSEEVDQIKATLDTSASEVATLKEQLLAKEQTLYQLNEPTREIAAELQVTQSAARHLEKELAQKAAYVSSLENERSHLVDKVGQLERELQAFELTVKKECLETEAVRGELSRVNFLKQSLETEIKTLRESLTRTDDKLRLKEDKLEKLQETLLEKQTEAVSLRQEVEARRLECTRSANQLEDSHRRELAKLESQLSKEREDWKNQAEFLAGNVDNLTAELKEAEENAFRQASKGDNATSELAMLQQTCESAVNRVGTLEVENGKLKQTLAKAQKKREMAKAEVIRLSYKLEQKSSSEAKPWVKLNSGATQPQDMAALQSIRYELEVLYKELMGLMMNAQTSSVERPHLSEQGIERRSGPTLQYLMSADDLSSFERRLNNLSVQVHECTDVPTESEPERPQTEPRSWSSKISGAVNSIRQSVSGRGSVKLFSCMSGETNDRPKSSRRSSLKIDTGDHNPGRAPSGLSRS
jgi:chromosome segregation ATPase